MKLPINRGMALELLCSMPQSESDMNHYLASEAIMICLAKHFGEDENFWGMAGLLHDIDWAITKNDMGQHCIVAANLLRSHGFCPDFISPVQSHGYGMTEIPELVSFVRQSKAEHALVSAETLTGLIYAYALMRNRNISDMEPKGLKKKFRDKAFAANCNRNLILEIENTGLDLSAFFQISIAAISGIKEQIGLT